MCEKERKKKRRKKEGRHRPNRIIFLQLLYFLSESSQKEEKKKSVNTITGIGICEEEKKQEFESLRGFGWRFLSAIERVNAVHFVQLNDFAIVKCSQFFELLLTPTEVSHEEQAHEQLV